MPGMGGLFGFNFKVTSRNVADLLAKILPSRDIQKDVDGKKELYLRRFFITPRKLPWRIFLHYIARSDDDRDVHDHPWTARSFVFWNGYTEKILSDNEQFIYKIRRAPCLVTINSTHRHKVRLLSQKPTWSILLVGPTTRKWGFWTDEVSDFGQFTWVHWKKYLGLPDNIPESDEDQ